MGLAEAKKLVPFIARGAKSRALNVAKMTNKIEIIPEIFFGKLSPIALEWRRELEEWRQKILEIDQEAVFKGNESINELKFIYDGLKRTVTHETPDYPSF